MIQRSKGERGKERTERRPISVPKLNVTLLCVRVGYMKGRGNAPEKKKKGGPKERPLLACLPE